jgi:glycosyltransferase involved in cell wall biosynthesis
MSRRTPTRLVSFGEREERWRDEDLSIRILPRTHYVNGSRFNPVSPHIAGEIVHADVVHCHQQHILASSLAAISGRTLAKTVAVTNHGGGGLDFSWYVSTDALFHCHLHVSAFSRSSAGQDGDPRARVILGGVDPRTFSPEGGASRRGTRALFVGRLVPHKGVHDLIEALPAATGLDIIGPDTDRGYVRRLKSLALGRDVAFRGSVSDVSLAEFYRRALCVVLPSVYDSRFGGATGVPELLGQTLLEAMACGTPVIATNVGGMPETLIDGMTGFVVPPGRPAALTARLRELAGNADTVERLGKTAATHVRQSFDWDRVVDRCLEAYDFYSHALRGTSGARHRARSLFDNLQR